MKSSVCTHVLQAVFALLGAVSVYGCSATDPIEDAKIKMNSDGTVPLPDERSAEPTSCRACTPPFVESPGEFEFSGQLIVRPSRHVARDRNTMARQRLRDHLVKYYPEVDEYVIRVPAELQGATRGAGENQMVMDLMATGDYEYVTPNWIAYPIAVPNDPLYGQQWHHPKIQAPQAWDLLVGSSSVVLAFTDTGIDVTHPDLSTRRVVGFNSVSDLAELDGGDVSDINGHGTHVAGCAAAMGNNGVGVSGVGWNFRLMMVRVSNSSNGSASLDDITQGARWAAENGAKVISSSYSGVDSPSVNTTGTYIKSLGALYLYAAGNDARNLNGFDHADVVVVGASDQNDARASFSAYGPAIDVFAPGVQIYSTLRGGGYGLKSGTSMATPITNGVAGMIWSVDPNFSPAQVEDLLFSTADDLGASGDDSTFGWGRVNVLRGVQAARDLACTHDKCSTGEPLGSGCEPCTMNVCTLDPFCCNVMWDGVCVSEVELTCGTSCN